MLSYFIATFLNISIIGLFLYSKLLPYKDRLSGQYRSIFNFFDSFFTPIFTFLKKYIKPSVVGQGLAVDMTQIILLIVFLTLINFI